MRRTRGKGFSSSTCHPESCKLNLPGQLQTIFLPGLRVLASGSADAGARPVCIALTPPPGMAQGGYFAGGLPCGGTQGEAASSVTAPQSTGLKTAPAIAAALLPAPSWAAGL